jgi:hypothetical protein
VREHLTEGEMTKLLAALKRNRHGLSIRRSLLRS